MRLRGDSTIVATAVLLAATLAAGITLLVYASNITNTSVGVKACTPASIRVAGATLLYNPCPYSINTTLLPRTNYTIIYDGFNATGYVVVLGSGDAALVVPSPKAIIVNNLVVPLER